MLVLRRKAGDEIVISHGEIRISVLEITGKRVRLGVSAPSGVPVHRQEIQQRIIRAAKSETEREGDLRGLP
jgi:carbon storage regulator